MSHHYLEYERGYNCPCCNQCSEFKIWWVLDILYHEGAFKFPFFGNIPKWECEESRKIIEVWECQNCQAVFS